MVRRICSIVWCNASRNKLGPKLTFHSLPTKPLLRERWLEAIGIENLRRDVKRLEICSLHFDKDRFYRLATSVRLLEDTVPTLFIKVCRICLATNVKLFDINDNMNSSYTQLTAPHDVVDDRLPQMLCWECAHRLRMYEQFKNKALKSRDLLLSAIDSNQSLTLKTLRSIDRKLHGLSSTLSQTNTQNNIPIVDMNEPKQQTNYPVINNFPKICPLSTSDIKTEYDDKYDSDSYIVGSCDNVTNMANDITSDIKTEYDNKYDNDSYIDGSCDNVTYMANDVTSDIKKECDMKCDNKLSNYASWESDCNIEYEFNDVISDIEIEHDVKCDNDSHISDRFDSVTNIETMVCDVTSDFEIEHDVKCDNDSHIDDRFDSVTNIETMVNDVTSDIEIEHDVKYDNDSHIDNRFDSVTDIETIAIDDSSDTDSECVVIYDIDTKKNNVIDGNCDRKIVKQKQIPNINTYTNSKLLNIQRLPREDQIGEVSKREESEFNIKEYDAHVLRHSEIMSGAYQCIICKVPFRSQHSLDKHISGKHMGEDKSKECDFSISHSQIPASTHLKLMHYMKKFVCAMCGNSYISTKGLSTHMKRKHTSANVQNYLHKKRI